MLDFIISAVSDIKTQRKSKKLIPFLIYFSCYLAKINPCGKKSKKKKRSKSVLDKIKQTAGNTSQHWSQRGTEQTVKQMHWIQSLLDICEPYYASRPKKCNGTASQLEKSITPCNSTMLNNIHVGWSWWPNEDDRFTI